MYGSKLSPRIIDFKIPVNLLSSMSDCAFHIRAKLLGQLTTQKDNIVLISNIAFKIILALMLKEISNSYLGKRLIALIGTCHINLHVF